MTFVYFVLLCTKTPKKEAATHPGKLNSQKRFPNLFQGVIPQIPHPSLSPRPLRNEGTQLCKRVLVKYPGNQTNYQGLPVVN